MDEKKAAVCRECQGLGESEQPGRAWNQIVLKEKITHNCQSKTRAKQMTKQKDNQKREISFKTSLSFCFPFNIS